MAGQRIANLCNISIVLEWNDKGKHARRKDEYLFGEKSIGEI
jgi:hypothetical protein